MSTDTKTTFGDRIKGLSPKAKQYLVLGGLGSMFFALVLGGTALWDNKPPMAPQAEADPQKNTKNIASPGAQVDPRDVWMTQSSQQMKETEAVVQGLKQKLTELEQKQATPQPPAQKESILPPLPPIPPQTMPSQGQGASPMAGNPPPLLPLPQPLPEPKKSGIAVFEVSDAPSAPVTAPADQETRQGKTYIPSGSFMRVVLLGGLDAPTGGQAQSNPWPVLLRVQGNAFLPNRYRANIKECNMLGSGYGDISSERAFLRLESLSCVLKSGEVVDTTVKGYVVGEDGKAGMRGRLVSKQGQVLANALMTGIIAGIGQGFQQSSTSFSTSALGSVGTVEPGKQFQAGIGAGVGKALDRLSQYYITLAEKMFPVIEIDAARVVDVVLTKGVTLGLGSGAQSADEGDYSEIWKRGRAIMKKPLNPME
jgi:conjugal transfer pilus assembly protein TraB